MGHRKVSTVLKPKADCTAPGGGTQMFHQLCTMHYMGA
nr:MAG TPA: hypothetical protein [Caudoviricetes sp.]DAU15612.1 MAG TPA: hypothetical protein [Caudoviricetes sp.]